MISKEFETELLALLKSDDIYKINEKISKIEYSDKKLFFDILKFIFESLVELKLNKNELLDCWRNLKKHYWLLSEKLGRDPGLALTSFDYFININNKIKDPILISKGHLESIRKAAFLDQMTLAYNKNMLYNILSREESRSRRYQKSFSILLFDFDNFKDINDTFGHFTGDAVLKEFVRILRVNLRSVDYIIRFGGDEFFIILPDTPKDGGKLVAERILEYFINHPIIVADQDEPIYLGLSGGLGVFHPDTPLMEDLLQKIDAALYKAKKAGKKAIFTVSVEHEKLLTIPPGIELIAESISEAELPDQEDGKKLAGGGIIFSYPEMFGPNTILKLKLNIKEKEIDIIAYGKIQNVRSDDNLGFELDVIFLFIDQDDYQIFKHFILHQIKELARTPIDNK